MGKLSKQILISATLAALNAHTASSIPTSSTIYDTRPKNHFRGGSIGKGGKVKYRRN